MPRPLITFTSDFGHSDAYVGSIKGVILSIAPDANIIDISHEIPPRDILTAALTLDAALDYFPLGAIHLAVVDPGVGTSRLPLALQTERGFIIGPDNGIFSLMLDRFPPQQIIALTNPAFHLPHPSATFHGRDIFAPAAAHLAAGIPLLQLGKPVSRIERLDLPEPVPTLQGFDAEIIAIDRFGNLISNLRREHLASRPFTLQISGRTIHNLSHTFADVPSGHLVSYVGSSNRLEIAIASGNAARILSVPPGSRLSLQFT